MLSAHQRKVHGRRILKDTLQLYLDDIGSAPLLNREQEVELGKKAQAGDEKARDLMIRSNLRLVVSIARKFENMGLPFMDLISEGNIGLMKAVDRFNPEGFDNKFSTYAVWWIKSRIRIALLSKSRTVRLPCYIGRRLVDILKAKTDLEEKLGRPPFEDEIAKEVGVSEETVKALFDFNTSSSLEAMSENGEDIAIESDFDGETGKIERSDMASRMFEKIDLLKEKEKVVLTLRFGLDGKDPLTLKQVGKKLRMTGENIRLIQEKAIKKLSKLVKD